VSRIPRRVVGGMLVAAAMALPAGTAMAGTAFAGTFDGSRYVHVQPIFPPNPGGPVELNPQPLPPLDWAQLNPQPIPPGRFALGS
jgi:hypothetical protein